jgi:hypothetical protein
MDKRPSMIPPEPKSQNDPTADKIQGELRSLAFPSVFFRLTRMDNLVLRQEDKATGKPSWVVLSAYQIQKLFTKLTDETAFMQDIEKSAGYEAEAVASLEV